jgi:hypothetical protein
MSISLDGFVAEPSAGAGEDVLRGIFGALGDDDLAQLDRLLDAVDTAMPATPYSLSAG